MQYDFDRLIDRNNCGACKWMEAPAGALPMTIADMEFTSPPEVLAALHERVDANNYGYTIMTDEDYQAVIDFVQYRHGLTIPREHLLATPGVLYTMRCAMYMLTEPGDKVVVTAPLHTPSIKTAGMQGRIPLINWMRRTADGNYTFDYDDLEKQFQTGAKVLMMCSPNNPTGRVWTRAELEPVAELAGKYDVTVVSDEIHRDLIYKGYQFCPIADMPGMAERTISVFSPSKTFNFGGMHIGSAVSANTDYLKQLRSKLYEFGHDCGRPPVFSLAAQTAAYQHGRAWLEELITYLEGNADMMIEYLKDLPVTVCRPEASFLLWVDCSQLKLNTAELYKTLLAAGITADPGHYYDMAEIAGYEGLQHHFRLAFGMPRQQLEPVMEKLRKVLLELA
jgi:cystathionine beta-lyase